MPELAEVLWFARRWEAGRGKTVKAVDFAAGNRVFRDCDPDALKKALPGARLEKILTSGKQAAYVFSGNRWLGVHLGMTGRLFVDTARSEQPTWAREETGEATTFAPDPKHDLLRLTLEDGTALVFNDYRRFGKILFHAGPGEPNWWRERAPDILSEGFDAARLDTILDAHPRLAIKPLLLDQQGFPGIGNWMADEVLWRAGIAPRTPAAKLAPATRTRLLAALRETCADALRVIGEGFGAPPDSWLFNHRWRKGGICPATGAPLHYETIGGRTTCWSPAKQR